MKFGKELEQTLIEEKIPEEWIGAAIQYKVLKKFINKVVEELKLLGLEQNTLKLLLEHPKGSKIIEVDEENATPLNPVIAKYSLFKLKNADKSEKIQPMLKITIDYTDHDYTDDHILELGIELKHRIEKLLNENIHEGEKNVIELKENNVLVLSPQSSHPQQDFETEGTKLSSSSHRSIKKNEIIIVLNSDTKFFQLLEVELENLDKLKVNEEKKLIDQVETLSTTVKTLADPKVSYKKSDLYRWREIFRIYLDLEVFFRYNEATQPSSQRNAQQIKKNLEEFLQRIHKTEITTQFKQKKSLTTFNNFVSMNYHLLKVLQFQSLNTTALTKILKKFDKQTSLGISKQFPKLISSDHVFITGSSLAQKICYVMQLNLLKLVPQLDDYMCPICCSVAYNPIQLHCGHTFCVRCLVKLKKEDKTNCPLCRDANAVALADGSNLDFEKQKLIETYFPLEVKEKLKERNHERYEETMGKSKCVIM